MSGNTLGSWYTSCSFPVRNGVFYVGGVAPSIILGKAGADSYSVRDYWGNVVSSGSVSGTTCTPTAPSGGWKPGWYRAYFTGPSSDTTNGNAYAGTMFSVIRDDSRFPALPSGSILSYGNESAEPVGKAILGLGTSRVIMGSYAHITTGTDILTGCVAQVAASRPYWQSPPTQYVDSVRPHTMWCATPGPVVDKLAILGSAGGTYLTVYAATESVDSSQLFISASAGTYRGTMITVCSPDATTVVETFDNLGTSTLAATYINASSAFIKVFSGGVAAAVTTATTVIGRTVWNGIVTTVSTLYPDVTRYESTNENGVSAEIAHQMRLFAGAVHAGNAGAKAIGPCPVDINKTYKGSGWDLFLAAGGGNFVDEISFHDYNSSTNGNLPAARVILKNFNALVASYGLASKPMWQTEAGPSMKSVYGIHHPRRARVKILHSLLWEQYGIPRERNNYWYDRSHGFWSYPGAWQNGDSSVTADAPIHRVLAEETFGMVHTTRLPFGKLGDAIALGSVYAGSAGSCVVLCAASFMPNATVTLTVSGTSSPLTISDAFGNITTVPVVSGRVTVPLSDIPTYVRLPLGVSATTYSMNDWPQINANGQGTSSGPNAAGMGSSPINLSAISSNSWLTSYGVDIGESYGGISNVPDSVGLRWPTATRFDRVIIWNIMSWQHGASFVDFDIQTSNDGVTWTTQTTVTKPTPSSFLFGTNSTNTWCVRETYWDEQWIFDVPLPAPVTCQYMRVYVRSASYGGEPDALAVSAGGQGDSTTKIQIQEIAVLCDANVQPYIVTGSTI